MSNLSVESLCQRSGRNLEHATSPFLKNCSSKSLGQISEPVLIIVFNQHIISPDCYYRPRCISTRKFNTVLHFGISSQPQLYGERPFMCYYRQFTHILSPANLCGRSILSDTFHRTLILLRSFRGLFGSWKSLHPSYGDPPYRVEDTPARPAEQDWFLLAWLGIIFAPFNNYNHLLLWNINFILNPRPLRAKAWLCTEQLGL